MFQNATCVDLVSTDQTTKKGLNHRAAKLMEVVSFFFCARLISFVQSWQHGGIPRNSEPPSMAPLLRVALLCHLFVSAAGADRIATNVACLPNEPGQVFMILAGASATQRS